MMLIGIALLGLIIYLVHTEGSSKYRYGALESHIECYNCGHLIKDDFIYCPRCKVELKEKCKGCGKLINIGWRSCPYCNASKSE